MPQSIWKRTHLCCRSLLLFHPCRKMEETTRMYSVLGLSSFIVLIILNFRNVSLISHVGPPKISFVERNGTQFLVNGRPMYFNGWNSYWLMDQSVDGNSRERVRTMLRRGAEMGLTVVRTWAFNDGGYNALQIRPGVFDERVFQALDFVITEARQHGLRLILSLANNLNAYGGKIQYLEWANANGVNAGSSNDSFFINPTIRGYYKQYVKAILTRKNSISGIEYRNEPAIFAWELINEPRCMSDPSGHTLQSWISEMGKFVKSLDNRHLITVGLEGFYGQTQLGESNANPGEWANLLGSDFIRDSQIEYIDFASVHAYPDSWIPHAKLKKRIRFLTKWVKSHIEDAEKKLGKPVLFTEFGASSAHKGFQIGHRDLALKILYDEIYRSAKRSGAGAGSLVWQFLIENMDEYGDEYGFVPWQEPSTHRLIVEQSCRLKRLYQGKVRHIKRICSRLSSP